MKSIFCSARIFLAAAFILPGVYSGVQAQTRAHTLENTIMAVIDDNTEYSPEVVVSDAGTVTLRGDVGSLYDKLHIHQLAAGVKGVRKIKDELVVETDPVPDEIIRANILEQMRDTPELPEPDRISVDVADGIVFLTGRVSFRHEKLVAETFAAVQDGVQAIVNDIVVLPGKTVRSDANLSQLVHEIVRNRFPLLEGKVTVQVSHGVVDVVGEANSRWEMDNIRRVCMQLPGVKKVDEHLVLIPEI